jgi:hypothetical protein
MPHVTIKIDIQRLGLMSFSTMFDGTSKMAYGKKNLAASIVRSFEPVWGVPLLTQSRPCYTAGPSTPAQHSFPPLVHWRCCCLFGCQQAVYTSVQPQLGPTIEEREQIQQRKDRNQSKVDFAKDTFRFFRVEHWLLLWTVNI